VLLVESAEFHVDCCLDAVAAVAGGFAKRIKLRNRLEIGRPRSLVVVLGDRRPRALISGLVVLEVACGCRLRSWPRSQERKRAGQGQAR